MRVGRLPKFWEYGPTKTTVENPDLLFRRAKSRAADRGQSLNEYIAEALHEKLARSAGDVRSGEPPWMQGFGRLRRLRQEIARAGVRSCRYLRRWPLDCFGCAVPVRASRGFSHCSARSGYSSK